MSILKSFARWGHGLRRWDFWAVLALLMAGWKFALPAPLWWDVPTFDEARYLRRGVELLQIGLRHLPVEWSPLYSLWYHLLYRLYGPDRIGLYDLNFRLLGVVLPVALYLVLRRYRVEARWAFGLALYTLVAHLSWVQDTRVTTFALLLVFLTAWAAARQPGRMRRLWVGAWGLALAAYARPEYGPAAGMLFTALLVEGLRAWRRGERPRLPRGPRAWMPLLVPVVPALAAFFLWGTPLGRGRTMYAFGQHFALNRWYCLGRERVGVSWEDEIRDAFGEVSTPLQALLRNPRAFLQHVGCNVVALPPRLALVMFLHAAFFLPGHPRLEAMLLALVVAGAVVWQAIRRGKSIRHRAKDLWEDGALVYWLAVGTVALAVVLGIYSRKRYHLILLGWPFVVIGALLFLPRQEEGSMHHWRHLATLLLGVALVPSMGFMFADPWHPPFLPHRATLYAVQALDLSPDRTWRMGATPATGHYFLVLYLGPHFEALPFAPEEGFRDYLETYRPDLFLVDLRWYTGDEAWRAFFQNPEAFGYRAYRIHDTRWLYVRQR